MDAGGKPMNNEAKQKKFIRKLQMHNRQNAFDFVMKINLESEAYSEPRRTSVMQLF